MDKSGAIAVWEGPVGEVLLISALLMKEFNRLKKRKDKRIKGEGFCWIPMTHHKMQSETGLTRKQELSASSILQGIGIIASIERKLDASRRKYWTVNYEALEYLMFLLTSGGRLSASPRLHPTNRSSQFVE
jgi:hypothetical protein